MFILKRKPDYARSARKVYTNFKNERCWNWLTLKTKQVGSVFRSVVITQKSVGIISL